MFRSGLEDARAQPPELGQVEGVLVVVGQYPRGGLVERNGQAADLLRAHTSTTRLDLGELCPIETDGCGKLDLREARSSRVTTLRTTP